MIKIFDNIIPKKQQEELKYLLYGNRFPWYFVSDITHIENQNQFIIWLVDFKTEFIMTLVMYP